MSIPHLYPWTSAQEVLNSPHPYGLIEQAWTTRVPLFELLAKLLLHLFNWVAVGSLQKEENNKGQSSRYENGGEAALEKDVQLMFPKFK